MTPRKARAAAIYCRISEDRGGEGLGVQRQEADCRRRAEQMGWTVAEVYVDNDVSAYNRRKVRPQWRQMLAALEAGRVDGVLAYDLDRLARQPRDLEDLLNLAEDHGFPLANVTGDVDLATSGGRTQARVMVAFALKASEDTGRRVKRKHEESAQQGKSHGGPRPYGFRREREMTLPDGTTRRTGDLVPHSDEARVLVEAVRRILAGETLRAIARDLSARNIPTATGRGQWASQNLRSCLVRPQVGGLHSFGRDDHDKPKMTGHTVPGIVSAEDWYDMMAILEAPSRRVTPGPTRTNLLSGLVYCGVCGELLRVKVAHSGKRAAMACEKRIMRDVKHVTRAMGLLEELVTESVIRWLSEFKYTSVPVVTGKLADLARELGEVDRRRDAYLEQAANFSPDDMVKMIGHLATRRQELEAEILAHRQATTLGPFIGPSARERWGAATLEQRRAVLTHLVDEVVVQESTKRGRIADCATVEMRWRDGGVVSGPDTVEEWVALAVAVASDAAGTAQAVTGGLELGEVVETGWETWPGLRLSSEEAAADARSPI